MRHLLPWQRVEVSGPSMAPTLRHGDVLVVRYGARVRPGDVVLARFRTLPERLVLKRAVRPTDGGWWLASDNRFAGGDSDSHGVAEVLARVTWRVRPGRPARIARHARD
jgi:phage repressor protein C with HTH and peptisase S24 domain